MSDPHNDFDRYDAAMQARFTEGREQGRREGREEVYALVHQAVGGIVDDVMARRTASSGTAVFIDPVILRDILVRRFAAHAVPAREEGDA